MEQKNKMIRWKEQEGQIIISLNDRELLKIVTPAGAKDILQLEDNSLIKWIRKTEHPVTQMVLEAVTCYEPQHMMVPAISYDGNPWGKDHEYKGYEWNGVPYSYAWHRSAIPAATCSWGREAGVSLFAGKNCSGSIFKRSEKAVHRVIWPETEAPRVLYADGWSDTYSKTMEPTDTFVVYLCLGAGKEAEKLMLHHAWKMTYQKKKPVRSTSEVWKLSISYAKELYTEEKNGFHAFSIGFTCKERKWIKRPDWKYEIGWCGQNASLAVSLLWDYKTNRDIQSLQMAENVLDDWIKKARSPQGYLLTRYDPQDSLIDACNLGTAGLQFFEAWEMAGKLGIKKEEWYQAALEICTFAEKRQHKNGCFAMSWNQDGSIHEQKGTAGGFLILPLAECFLRIGSTDCLESALKAYDYYYGEFVQNGYGTSGALDTCCIDKESIIPLLKGGLLLYQATEDKKYLQMAEEAAWYLSTWQWHQSVDYPEGSVLKAINYDTFGGTAVSTSHHHMDAFALVYVLDLIELARQTGNKEWKERALAIWRNGVQGISDGSFQIPPTPVRPAGSADEGYLHTRWGDLCHEDGKINLTEEELYKNGNIYGVSQWLVAWPCAFRLEVLRKCKDWNTLDDDI